MGCQSSKSASQQSVIEPSANAATAQPTKTPSIPPRAANIAPPVKAASGPTKVEAIVVVDADDEDETSIVVQAVVKGSAASSSKPVAVLPAAAAASPTAAADVLAASPMPLSPAAEATTAPAVPSPLPGSSALAQSLASAPSGAVPAPKAVAPAAGAVPKAEPEATVNAVEAADVDAKADAAVSSSSGLASSGEPAAKSAAAPGVIPYPVCPGGAQSIKQQGLAPELVAKWEEEMAFTEEQQACFDPFRAALLQEGILTEMYDNKPSFFRFLQARQWDIEKATLMYRNHMVWRKEMDLDECLATEYGPVPKFLHNFCFPEIVEVKQAYNFTHHRVTKDGRPVYFDRLGTMNYKLMCEHASPEHVFKYFCWYAEATQHYRLGAASVACGKHHGKAFYVLDLKGFGLGKLNSDTRAFLKEFSAMASDNYPESMWKTYIVNAPMIFTTAWSFVSKLLDPNTVAKFKIMGGPKDYMPKLLEVVDAKDIPTFLGGEDDSCDFIDEKGVWASYMPTTKGPLLAARDA